MKRISTGIVAIACLVSTGAFAADLAPRPYIKAPVMVDPGSNWAGFYAGLNGGYSWGRANTSIAPFAGIFPVTAFAPFRQDVNGGLAGGQVGYNWQLDRTWVVGLEGDMQWSGERSSTSLTSVGPRYGAFDTGLPNPRGPDFNAIATQIANLSYDLQWFATFRGRAGVLADPQTLLYVTGGLAVGEFKYTAQTTTSVQVFTPGLGGTTPFGAPIAFAGTAASSSDTQGGLDGGRRHRAQVLAQLVRESWNISTWISDGRPISREP